MNDIIDQRLGALLREDAPPARDPRFRIALVERRQRQLYRQRARQRAVTFALLAVLPGLVLFAADQPLVMALLLAAVGGLVMSGMRAIAATRHAWRWASGALALQKLH
jgi:glucose-6-phosphate-specific signal transduction histidine kinase